VSRIKYLVLVGDGMGDYSCDALSGKTPLQAAHTPAMDSIAARGRMGLMRTIPSGKEAGSDVANLGIMGYDTAVFHTGRSPLEAASMGIELQVTDVAYRCNLVTLSFKQDGGIIMEDYAGGHISSEKARLVVDAIEKRSGGDGIHFFPGVSYRHILVWENGREDLPNIPPHDILGQEVGSYLNDHDFPRLNGIIRQSWPLFEVLRHEHPDIKANSIWLWGQGKAPKLPSFQNKYGLNGGVISAVDLLRGIGVYAGLTPIRVPGVTGYLDTNYAGKVEYALSALESMDIVYLHVEAPDEAAHSGELALKIRAIEDFDRQVVGPVMDGLKRYDHFRVLLITDHFTPISLRTHTREPVPFVIYDNKEAARRTPSAAGFNEPDAEAQGLLIEKAFTLMDLLVCT
jgi:2,3-bisphosphoglycerate-independent phosphoglycerate mutase